MYLNSRNGITEPNASTVPQWYRDKKDYFSPISADTVLSAFCLHWKCYLQEMFQAHGLGFQLNVASFSSITCLHHSFGPSTGQNAPPFLSNLSISTFILLQWLPHFPFINLSMIQAMMPMPYPAPNPSSAMKNVKHQFSFCCVNPSLKLQFSSAVPHSAFLMQSFFLHQPPGFMPFTAVGLPTAIFWDSFVKHRDSPFSAVRAGSPDPAEVEDVMGTVCLTFGVVYLPTSKWLLGSWV